MERVDIAVIGVGNRLRGDDGAGPLTIDSLRGCLPESVALVELSGEGAALIDLWEHLEFAIVIDAVSSDQGVGTIHRFDGIHQTLPSDFFHYSTHAFGLAEAIELARVLNRLPKSLLVYGVEGQTFTQGSTISSPVRHAIERIAPQIVTDIETYLHDLDDDKVRIS